MQLGTNLDVEFAEAAVVVVEAAVAVASTAVAVAAVVTLARTPWWANQRLPGPADLILTATTPSTARPLAATEVVAGLARSCSAALGERSTGWIRVRSPLLLMPSSCQLVSTVDGSMRLCCGVVARMRLISISELDIIRLVERLKPVTASSG
jgi:hypothetical protein